MKTAEAFRDPEVENPPVVEDDTLPAVRPSEDTRSMLERLVDDDEAERALQKIDTMTAILEKLRLASIKATFPSDWIIHTSKGADGSVIRQVGYLQDCGAERAGKVWGIEVGQPKIEFEKFEDGTFCYHMQAEAVSKVTHERIDRVDGSRWSGDRFFSKQIGPDEKVDPTDVRKSAWANLHGRAVRSLAGLGGVPLEILKKAGLDLSKVVNIGYETGAKGGTSVGAPVGPSAGERETHQNGCRLAPLNRGPRGRIPQHDWCGCGAETVSDCRRPTRDEQDEHYRAAMVDAGRGRLLP